MDLLLLAKSVYNNIPSTTTGVSPSFANKGYYPSINIHLERDITSSHTYKFIVNINELQDALKIDISTAQ